ncbi:MAG: acyl-CoA dehydrogenase N-terminal domain-containing protein, partial [SAR324 cluster bacterium]|nr:acyl-CoA dehydrogenase N-terminal domain-containing protein [SAR324 cluster bacterium]
MPETNFFKADLRELEFALFEQGRLTELLKSPPFDHLTEEDARLVLKEAHQFAMDVIGPTMSAADREGCQL